MHNEELGLLKREISSLYASLSDDGKELLDNRIQSMPVVPNFPRITMPLSKPSIFKAKHWITISKYICCAIHGLLAATHTYCCSLTHFPIDLVSSEIYQCMLSHVDYLNILCKPQLSDEDLEQVMKLMKRHNKLFVKIYCGNDSSKTFISIIS